MKGHLRRLALVEYEDALTLQRQLVEARQAERIPDQVLLVRHPHIFTLGRRADQRNILISQEFQKKWGVEVFDSVRGGDVTYHGPGQVVLYPIIKLPLDRQDVVRYVRDLEEGMIRTLADFGVTGGRISGLSGVWVGQDKIGAIGVRMARWVTSHGLALNVNTQLRYFDLIIPCGIRDHGVTSLETCLEGPCLESRVEARLVHHFEDIFEIHLEAQPRALNTVQVIICRQTPTLEILCLHRVSQQGGFWQPVTGKVEAGEAPRAAALREVQEETGLRGTLQDLDYIHDFMLDPALFSPPKWPLPCFVQEHGYMLEVASDSEVVLDPGSHQAHRWLSVQEAVKHMRWVGNRKGILRAAGRLSSQAEAPFPRSGETS